MSNLMLRVMTGIVLIAVVTGVLFVAPFWLFALVAIGFIGLGLNEFFEMVRRKGILVERWVGLVIGLLLPLSVCLRFEPTRGWELFSMVLVFLALFLLQMRREDSSILGIAATLFGIFYVSWCLTFLIKLRLLESPALPSGAWLVAFLLLVTKGGDIGAYLTGSLIGRHPLIRRISPSKTWEGTVGGLACSVAGAYALRSVFSQVSLQHLLLLGLLLGGLGQLSDLSESMIKRDSQVKDSGRLMPGMGGVLDVLDSLLFTSPICYLYMNQFLAKG